MIILLPTKILEFFNLLKTRETLTITAPAILLLVLKHKIALEILIKSIRVHLHLKLKKEYKMLFQLSKTKIKNLKILLQRILVF